MENPFNNSSYHYIFKDNGEEHVTHSESDNIEIMINDKADEVIEEFFNHYFPDIAFGWKHQ